jgi:hypothetical protein
MKRGFVIDSLPRTGSTTLARLLNTHPDIRCLVEPFHPLRYDGQFHKMALQAQSVEPALNLIWHRWSGIKHVWQASSKGAPFPRNPDLNDGIVLGAGRVVFLQRRNLLRRYVSARISQQLCFWIGTRQEYLARLENIQLREFEPASVLQEIEKDRAGIEQRLRLLREHDIHTLHLFYEDLFGDDATSTKQSEIMNGILRFLGYREISDGDFMQQWAPLLDKNTYQWASAEVYRMIPGIEQLEHELGSDETGWLF